jgi:hypothetical protein
MPTLIIISVFILFISAIHSCYNGGRIAKAAQSSNPEVRKDTERSITIILAIGAFCILYFIWPLLLLLLIIYVLIKLFKG